MIDLYLHAPTKEALSSALAPLGLDVDGDLMVSHRHSLVVISESDIDGIVVAIRCLDNSLAAEIRGVGVSEVERPAAFFWAGGGHA